MIRRVSQRVRHAWPPGLRAQITLGYSIVIMLGLLVLLPLSFIVLGDVVTRSATDELSHRADLVASEITYVNTSICFQEAAVRLPGLQSATQCFAPGQSAHVPPASSPASLAVDPLVRVLDLDERVVYASPDFALLKTVPTSAASDALRGVKWSSYAVLPGGEDAAVLSVGIVDLTTQRTFGVLQIAQTVGNIPKLLREIEIGFVIGAPLLALLGVWASYGLAGRALRPVKRLTVAARRMHDGDLRQRVPVPLAHDDVYTLAESFNDMAGQVAHSFEQQRRFVADASHELRTPVAVIRNITDVALAGAPTRDEALVALRDVNAEAERLSRLLNMLLHLARADDRTLALEREVIQLDVLARDLVESVLPLAAERGLDLGLESVTPVQIFGDPAQVIQIVMSLVENALKYTPAGGVVRVSVGASEARALVLVRDTGIGIAPEDLPHIFERFYRADPARSRTSEGAGLGLALAQEFAHAHGGEITANSVVGQGATFILNLPRT
jgi:two-component system, OmpR family, sensor kinase